MPNVLKNVKNAAVFSDWGWSVLPLHGIENGRCTCGNPLCPRPGKHPAIVSGIHEATMDIAQVHTWFLPSPGLNVGIATGEISDLLVLDINKQEGGFESLAAAINETGPLPEELTVRTGGGGEHRYFWLPPGNFTSDFHGKLVGPGVNVLVDGSYVVAPGSRHISGKKYKWQGEGPDETRMPGFLSEAWSSRLQGPPTIAHAAMIGDVGDVLGWSGAITLPSLGDVHLVCRGKLHFGFNYGTVPSSVPASAKAVFLVGTRRLNPREVAVWVEDIPR